MSQPPDDMDGIGTWHVVDTDDGLIDLGFENVTFDGVETFSVMLSPGHARVLAAALIEFADALE